MSISDRVRLLPPGLESGWTLYAWLIYLPVFFIQPAMGHASPWAWAAHIAAAALLVVTYFRSFWPSDGELAPIMIVQAALGAAFAPWNAGALVFFMYAVSVAGRLERKWTAVGWIAAISTVGLAAALASAAPPALWIGPVIITPLIGGAIFHQAGVARTNARLRAAHAEIERLAAMAERERIARDLHDVLGHTLSLIVLKSELASRLGAREPERAMLEIREVESVARRALHEVREAIKGYRPTLADELTRAQALLAVAGIEPTIDARIATDDLRSRASAEETLALALREAVTNVVRHSKASRTTIRAWHDADHMQAVLEVVDNGRGHGGREGAGLRGMRERVAAVNGSVTSSHGNGTRLSISIPLAEQPRRAG